MKRLRCLATAALLLLSACAPAIRNPAPPTLSAEYAADSLAMRDGAVLPLRAWLPKSEPAAVIVALHGMNDYSNAYAESGRFLADQGLAVYAYDQRGFGRGPSPGLWAGAQVMADDLTEVTRQVAARHPGKPVYVLGESMGGAVTMVAMTGPHPPKVEGVILSAPAVWGRDYMNVFERGMLWMLSNTLPSMTLTGGGLKIMPSDNIEMLRGLSRDPLVLKETRVDAIHGLVDLMDAAFAAAPRLTAPALVLYGERDEIVPADPTFAMIEALPRRGEVQRVALYAQGYHMLMRDLEAKLVLGDIVAWIKAPRAPLPSGADGHAVQKLGEVVKG